MVAEPLMRPSVWASHCAADGEEVAVEMLDMAAAP